MLRCAVCSVWFFDSHIELVWFSYVRPVGMKSIFFHFFFTSFSLFKFEFITKLVNVLHISRCYYITVVFCWFLQIIIIFFFFRFARNACRAIEMYTILIPALSIKLMIYSWKSVAETNESNGRIRNEKEGKEKQSA